jgi:hypothetical protein
MPEPSNLLAFALISLGTVLAALAVRMLAEGRR